VISITKTSNADFLNKLNYLFQRELPRLDSGLAQAASYHFRSSGKAFRAKLAFSSGKALRLPERDSLHWAAACELLHNASLIHDDISDASTHRRGQQSINQYFGSDVALCLGDWMVAKAFELGARNPQHGAKLVALLAQSMQDTCHGQTSDLTQRTHAPIRIWKRIAAGKTAPLLIAPVKGAAIAAELNENLASLEQLVTLCGLVYQARNDIDDIIFSDHRSNDLHGRKPNLVVTLFIDKCMQNEGFLNWYGSNDISRVKHWQTRLAASAAICRTNELIDLWLEEASALIHATPHLLHRISTELVTSVKQNIVVKRQGQIA
jgi:geranylgeranyl pyrophosphate synthase